MNNTIELNTKFFLGGNATFTVDNGKGTHYTFRIRQPKQRAGYTGPAPHFISLLTGPDNENSYTYMGIVKEVAVLEPVVTEGKKTTNIDLGKRTLQVSLTRKSKYNDDSTPVKVARWILGKVMTNNTLPPGYTVKHCSKCGCCGRTLTEPLSLKIGIGPECRKKLGL